MTPTVYPTIISGWQITGYNYLNDNRMYGQNTIWNSEIYVIGGYRQLTPNGYFSATNDVITSSDTIDWTTLTNNVGFTPRFGDMLLNAGTTMYIYGGYDPDAIPNYQSDIYRCVDNYGIVWTKMFNTPLPGRAFDTFTLFNNNMYIIGGQNASTVLSDIWVSPNGGQWLEITSNAIFGARYMHTTIAYNNKLWVIGGYDINNNPLTDVWNSSDGKNWTQIINNVAQLKGTFTGLVYQNRMYLIGGLNYSNNSITPKIVLESIDGVSWKQISTLPINNIPCIATVYNGHLYIITFQNSSTVFEAITQ
jgi:hypothetical protein